MEDDFVYILNYQAMSLSSSTVGGKIKFKIVLLGDQHVGKTSIIERFINDRYETTYDVSSIVSRLPLESTSSSEISPIKIKTTGCSCGTQQDRNASVVSYPVI